MDNKLTIRERLTIHLVLLLIKIIKPYQYSHEYKAEWDGLNKLINE